jgi:hypothetical protein
LKLTDPRSILSQRTAAHNSQRCAHKTSHVSIDRHRAELSAALRSLRHCEVFTDAVVVAVTICVQCAVRGRFPLSDHMQRVFFSVIVRL